MFSALAFSWEVNQLKVNRLVNNSSCCTEGLWLDVWDCPTANFSDFPPGSSSFSASLREETPGGKEATSSSKEFSTLGSGDFQIQLDQERPLSLRQKINVAALACFLARVKAAP